MGHTTEVTRETRFISVSGIEFEERAESNEMVLTALAHRTGVRATIWDFTEEITPGAFRSAIPDSDVVLNVNHGRSSGVLARTTSGTMRVWENDDGLMLRARLGLADPESQSLVEKVKRGDLSELSFAFSIDRNGQVWSMGDDDDMPHRQILRVQELFDVSIVERPAFSETGVESLRDKTAAKTAHMSRYLGKAMDDAQRIKLYQARLRGSR